MSSLTCLTGRWVGHFEQRGREHPLGADLVHDGSWLSGALLGSQNGGPDPAADAPLPAPVLEGWVRGEEVSFRRSVPEGGPGLSRPVVSYRGLLSPDGGRIEGTWRIEADAGRGTAAVEGYFFLRRVEDGPSLAPEPPRAEAEQPRSPAPEDVCPHCGAELPPVRDLFCGECRQELPDRSSPPASGETGVLPPEGWTEPSPEEGFSPPPQVVDRSETAGPPGPGFWGAVGLCLLFGACQNFVLLFVGPLVAALPGMGSPAALGFTAAVVTAFVVCFLMAAKIYRGRFRRCLAVRRLSRTHLALVLLLVFPLAVVGFQVSTWVAPDRGQGKGPERKEGGPAPGLPPAPGSSFTDSVDQVYEEFGRQSWALVLVVGCLLPALWEEVFFRGLLGRGLLARRGLVLELVVTALLFAVNHLTPARIAYTAVLGVGLHLVYLAARSLWAPVLLHGLNNVLAFGAKKLAEGADYDLYGTYGSPHVPPFLFLAALTAVGVLGVLFYRTRVRWLLPDGSEWSPGYRTAEAPPEDLAARPGQRSAGLWAVPAALGACGLVAGAFFHAQANPGELYQASLHRQEGDRFLDGGELDRAVAEYTESLRLLPGQVDVLFNRGLAYFRKEEWDRAVTDFGAVIRRRPAMKEAYFNRAIAYHELGRYAEAVKDYSRVLEREPNDLDALLGRADASLAGKDYDGAIQDYNRAIDLGGVPAQAYFNRGRAHSLKGELGPAIGDYSAAIARGKKGPEVYFARAVCYHQRKDWARALAGYDRVLALDSRHAPARINRARVRLARKDYDGAIADYTAFIRLRPQDPDGYRGRAEAFLFQGDARRAEEDAKTAAKLGPDPGEE